MPIGVVSDEEFELESEKIVDSQPKPKVVEAEVIDSTLGRGEGSLQVPNSLRQIIGEESEINGRASALAMAREFGISPSSVSAYANGSTSTATYDEVPNKPHIVNQKLKIAKRARVKLIAALANITQDKLADSKARELAGVAKDLSAVVKDMESNGNTELTGDNTPKFVFYAPHFHKEDHYDTIVVKE